MISKLEIWVRSTLDRGRRAITTRVSSRFLMILVPTLFLSVVVVIPLVYFVWGSVWTTTPGFGGHFTLDGYRHVLSSSGVRDTLANTFILTVFGTSTAVAVGLLTIVVTLKTDIPDWMKMLVSAILIVQLLLPTFIQGLAWEFYLGPRGPINRLLVLLPMFDKPQISANSIWAISFVFGTHYAGLVYLLTNGAFKAISQDMEEVALISGASERSVFSNIDLRLIAPTLLISIIIVLVRGIQSFGLPLVLGLPNRVFTLATLMYFELGEYPRDFTFIAALGIIILLLSLWLLIVQQRISGTDERYETIKGGGESMGTLNYVDSRWIPWSFFAFVMLVYVFPFVMVLIGSFQRTWVGLRPELITWSLQGYRTLLVGANTTVFYRSIGNGLALGVITALMALFLGVIISYLRLKTN